MNSFPLANSLLQIKHVGFQLEFEELSEKEEEYQSTPLDKNNEN